MKQLGRRSAWEELTPAPLFHRLSVNGGRKALKE